MLQQLPTTLVSAFHYRSLLNLLLSLILGGGHEINMSDRTLSND